MHLVTISRRFPFVIAAASAVSAATLPLEGRNDHCPYDPGETHTIEMNDFGTANHWTLEISYLGKGSVGCAYNVESAEGSTRLNRPAVAKTPRLDRNSEFAAAEVRALNAIGELYAYGHDTDSREWIVMKKHSGNVVNQTPEWKERFSEGCNVDYSEEAMSDCAAFMNYIYELVADRVVAYARQAGYYHRDWNWANYLFDDELTEVNIIDWGNAEEISPYTDFEHMRNKLVDQLETDSQFPIEDTSAWQGICDSQMRREELIPYRNPLCAAPASNRWSSPCFDGSFR